MKVLILAGGYGTRLSEETDVKPKPMVNIGEMPIIWHIMKFYSSFGFNEFIILLGYKGYIIKEFFHNYFIHNYDVTIDLDKNTRTYHKKNEECWKIDLIDTGLNAMTGGRIKQAQRLIDNKTFMLTYGDGLSDVNLNELIKFHKNEKKLLTMTAVQPDGRYGSIDIDGNSVSSFEEKPKHDNYWINGGYFVCEPDVLNYIEDHNTIFEKEPLEKLAKEGQISAFKHNSYWGCMDTMRDKNNLNDLWNKNSAPWKKWK